MQERQHTIALAMDYDHATLVVQRTVANGGERHDQAVFWIDVPEGAVAAGLRTRGLKNGRPHWFAGELFEANKAAERYRELTGIGGYYPKDPALLSWRSQDQLALQVFPVDPGGKKTIEYTLHLPVVYEGGRYHLEVPPMGTEVLAATAELRPAHVLDQLFVDDVPVAAGKRIMLDDKIRISLGRRDAPRVEGRLASLPFDDDRVLVQYEVDAAAKLSEVPSQARVVVLIDTSRSVAQEDLEASVHAARAYLGHFAPRKLASACEVITFAREATARHGAWVEPATAIADLETLAPKRQNGSNVDVALERAVQTFADAPRGAPRRIVLFTDTLTRSSLTPARLRTLATRSGALVHVVLTHAMDSPALDRDDDQDWATIARSTGGVLWHASASSDMRDDMHRAFEELARPVRIDHLRVHAPGLSSIDEVPSSLDEGTGFGDLHIAAGKVRYLKLEGELWSRPFREVVMPSDHHAQLWAGLVFGSELIDDLTEPQMMRLAMHGRVVSPVTSYLAIEPGVRPSTEGLDEGEGTIGLGGLGLIGKGGGGGTGSGFGRAAFDANAWLRDALRAALKTCGANAQATMQLETNRDEIADVVSLSVTSGDATTTTCVREEIWSTDLDPQFTKVFAKWTISVD